MTKLSAVRALVAFVLMCVPVTAVAQEGERPTFVAGALYDANTRTTGEVGVLFPLKRDGSEGVAVCRCLEATAAVGPGGTRFAVGPSFHSLLGPLFISGTDARFTILRTFDSTRGVMPKSTYVGGDGGFVFFSVRVGVGVAHRVSGPGPRDTVFTWNVGIRAGW